MNNGAITVSDLSIRNLPPTVITNDLDHFPSVTDIRVITNGLINNNNDDIQLDKAFADKANIYFVM